jgi:hypothetical protein
MGLFNRIQSARPHHGCADTTVAGAATGPSHRQVGTLPPDTPEAERRLWESMAARAEQLVSETNANNQLKALYPWEKRIHEGPKLTVNPSTLLERVSAHGTDRVIGHRLHANQVSADTVVMATPRHRESALWKQNATDQSISYVVRIGTPAEEQRLDLAAPEGSNRPLGSALKPASSPVLSRHWAVEMSPGAVVPPSEILNVCEKLAARQPSSTHKVAFQSPEGDDRSALFAAGWMLYTRMATAARVGKGASDQETVEDLVHEVVGNIRSNRSSMLLPKAEHLTTLLALGEMLRTKDLSRTITFSNQRHERVFHADQPVDHKVRLAARRAAPHADRTPHAAASRSFCEALAQSTDAVAGEFMPIKGGKGTDRIRADKVLLQDARLRGLEGGRLYGAWAARKLLVLERPQVTQSLAWAAACLTHNIAAVLDVSGEGEREESNAMPKGTLVLDSEASATFDWDRPTPTRLEGLPAVAHAANMKVSCHVRGEDLVRDISQEPPQLDRQQVDARVRPLALVDLPLEPHQPVPPAKLLALAEAIQCYRTEGTDDAVAVQCPPGDGRGALVAAADLLYTRCQGDQVDGSTLVITAKDIWRQLCMDYSIDLARHPEHLESLIAMGELALEGSGKRSGR